MTQRCHFGCLRLILDSALEDHGSEGVKYQSLHLALSKVRESLRGKPFSIKPSGENIQVEVEDCALLKKAEHPCKKDLEGLLSILVFILAAENHFTSHAAGKIFTALFDYLLEMTSLLAFVLNFIWKVLHSCFSDAKEEFLKQGCPSAVDSSSCLPAKNRISTFDCKVATNVFQILHGFLRKCKEEGPANFLEYLASSALYTREVLPAFTKCFSVMASNPVKHNMEEEDFMLAAFLRFLCSFNHIMSLDSSVIDAANVFSNSEYLCSLNEFLAALSQRCLNVHQHSCRIAHYLRHKFLMLMFRLHEWFIKLPLLAHTCSEILKANVSTLCPSMFQKQSQLLVPSTFSPFALCLLERKAAQSLASFSLQPERHAVYLIFKVELSLSKTAFTSAASTKVGPANCRDGTKLQEQWWVLNWLLSQVSMAQNLWNSGPGEVADCLASSFLQIFAEEDTLMLEMLLLIQDNFIPDLISRSDTGHEPLHKDLKLLTEIFKPLRLFAVFLLLISYDHSVILDFLISKDTSLLCLQYLIRCMRMMKSTWPDFLCLSPTSSNQHTRTGKYKELDVDASSLIGTQIEIGRVGSCLIQLKLAVEKLHKKQTFPYNPSPLLKHLESFEHLWLCSPCS